jgi:hypothetical protein
MVVLSKIFRSAVISMKRTDNSHGPFVIVGLERLNDNLERAVGGQLCCSRIPYFGSGFPWIVPALITDKLIFYRSCLRLILLTS